MALRPVIREVAIAEHFPNEIDGCFQSLQLGCLGVKGRLRRTNHSPNLLLLLVYQDNKRLELFSISRFLHRKLYVRTIGFGENDLDNMPWLSYYYIQTCLACSWCNQGMVQSLLYHVSLLDIHPCICRTS